MEVEKPITKSKKNKSKDDCHYLYHIEFNKYLKYALEYIFEKLKLKM